MLLTNLPFYDPHAFDAFVYPPADIVLGTAVPAPLSPLLNGQRLLASLPAKATSFSERVLPNDPNFANLQIQDNAQRLMPVKKPTALKGLTLLEWLFYIYDAKQYWTDGGASSLYELLADWRPSIQMRICDESKYPEIAALWDQPMQQSMMIPYILHEMSILTDADKEAIALAIRQLFMPESAFLNLLHYRAYLLKFLRLRNAVCHLLGHMKDKQWLTAFIKGLRSSPLKEFGEDLLRTTDCNSFPQGIQAIEKKVTYLTLMSGLTDAAIAHGGREERRKAFKPKAHAATASDSSVDATASAESGGGSRSGHTASIPLHPGQSCFNCKKDHKVFQCTFPCKLPSCPLSDAHKAMECPLCTDSSLRNTLFEAINSRQRYLRYSSSYSTPTLPPTPTQPTNSVNQAASLRTTNRNEVTKSWKLSRKPKTQLSHKPSIQYDPGCNIFASPVPLSDSPVTPIAPGRSIEVANGEHIPITASQFVGCSELFIAPALSSALVPQQYFTDQQAFTIINGQKLYICINNSTDALANFLKINPPIRVIESTNNLFYMTTDDLSFPDSSAPLASSAVANPSIARYNTARFNTARDVVLFWHIAMGHPNLEKMIAVVRNDIYVGLPATLTVENIRKYFPHQCVECTIGNLQRVPRPPAAKFNESVPVGALWSIDFKKFSGTDGERQVLSYGKFTHMFIAVDYRSSRAYGYPTKGTGNVVDHLQNLQTFNSNKGYTMFGITVDREFVNKAVTKFLSQPNSKAMLVIRDGDSFTSTQPQLIIRTVAIPHDHFSLGGAERINRTIHESVMKNSLSNPLVTTKMWNYGAINALDIFNSLPTAHNPTASPYQLYDKFTIDVNRTPILPYGTLVVAQIPLEKQTIRTGRGFKALVIGRAPEHVGGLLLFNLKTHRTIIRRTFKIVDDSQNLNSIIFDNPISIEIDDGDDIDTFTTDVSPIVPPPLETIAPTPAALPVPQPALIARNYRSVNPKTSKGKHIKYLKYVDTTFWESSEDPESSVPIFNKIVSIVSSKKNPTSMYFQYYNLANGMPTLADDFEYTLCSVLTNCDWANFNTYTPSPNKPTSKKADSVTDKYYANGMRWTQLAHKARSASSTSLPPPKDFKSMMKHPERHGYYAAMLVEFDSWKELGAIKPGYQNIDWDSIDPLLIGDLMLLFDKKFRPDGTFEKYKCRMVFRGDRWINTDNYPKYASSVDNDSMFLLLAMAVSEDLDIWKTDIKTAFLHGVFPEGMSQYVRSPWGVPTSLLPRRSELGACPYGHPLAQRQWKTCYDNVLAQLKFYPINSSPSVYAMPLLPNNKFQAAAAVSTDDTVFVTPYNSPLKAQIQQGLNAVFSTTTEDPIVNILGMSIKRNRVNRTAEITQPKFMEQCTMKYPLEPNEEYPSTPMVYSKYLSVQDRIDQSILLTPEQLTQLKGVNGDTKEHKEFQGVLGDCLWIAMHTKPIVKFALQVYSRKVSPAPTLYDFKQARRIMMYCIGTKHIPRIIGGKFGAVLTTAVDSSPQSWPDGTGQTSYSIHVGGGGAAILDSVKQKILTGSSAECEVHGNEYLVRTLKWARNFLEELGFDQRIPFPDGTPTGEDNQSAMRIISNECSSGKTRHMDLRIKIIREALKNKIFKMFHLPTENMPPDLGTKALAPGVFNHLADYCLGHKELQEFLPFLQHLLPTN